LGFHRSDQNVPTSSRWRRANRSLLAKCGVPDAVADSDRRWAYLLLHGEDELGTSWDVSWISPQQAAKLLSALVRDLPSAVGFDLLPLLRQRTGA
jgi:hypothetical protein